MDQKVTDQTGTGTQMINQPVSQPVSQPLADSKSPQTSSQTVTPPPSPKQNILGTSLLEVLFVAILLVIIFGVLNFFNIIPLSQKIPFLSFLPHQQVQIPTPTPSPQFFYDSNTANNILTDFIHTSLASSYLPSSPSAQLYITHKDNIFQAIWFVNGASTTATYAYTKNANTLSYQVISIGPISFPSSNNSASNSASSLSKQFFQNPPLDWKCFATPSSPNWQCVSKTTSTQHMYSLQRIDTGADIQINAQICDVPDKKLLATHPELGCLAIFNQNQ